MFACNGDSSGCESDERAREVEESVAAMGAHLVPSFDSETDAGIHEFSRSECDCCGDTRAGSRHEFAILAALRFSVGD